MGFDDISRSFKDRRVDYIKKENTEEQQGDDKTKKDDQVKQTNNKDTRSCIVCGNETYTVLILNNYYITCSVCSETRCLKPHKS